MMAAFLSLSNICDLFMLLLCGFKIQNNHFISELSIVDSEVDIYVAHSST